MNSIGQSEWDAASLFGPFGRTTRTASLVDLDPDLFSAVGPLELSRVREVGAHVADLDLGRWEPSACVPEAGLGLLVVEGLLVRTITLGEEVAAELVGAGDIIRPWETSYDSPAVISCPTGWMVVEPTCVAVLGRQIATIASDCPGFVAALLERTSRRTRSQGVLSAIPHLKRIDVRVLVLLWHLAERWGRVTGDGVLVPIQLTHQRLAMLVGAQRPSVTGALSKLASRGSVLRTPARGFLLTDTAREELSALCREGERAVPPLPPARV